MYIYIIYSSSTACPNTKLLGKGASCKLTDTEIKNINDLLSSNKLPQLTTNYTTVHTKAIINGEAFSSKENKRPKRSNDYTIAYTGSNHQQCYALVNKYLSIQNTSIAFITELSIHIGPSYDFSSYITTKSTKHIFVHQIKLKCINLSFAGKHCKTLTLPVNSVEKE